VNKEFDEKEEGHDNDIFGNEDAATEMNGWFNSRIEDVRTKMNAFIKECRSETNEFYQRHVKQKRSCFTNELFIKERG
jgi:hypothetical protein